MSLMLFEGAAGTGKTTKLIESARLHLASHPLQDEQRVLALTKYHGSRKRMSEKLMGSKGLAVPVDCMTIDSFAWHLLRRWRTLASRFGRMPGNGDFQAITALAGSLLKNDHVGAWVSRRYPMVVVDEMQDCSGYELEVLRGLEKHLHVLAAADAFQDLSGDDNNAAVTWAQSVGKVEVLHRVHRTSVNGLLTAAAALRSRQSVPILLRPGFEIKSVAAAALAGWNLSMRIKWWSKFGEIAIISPTRPKKSAFVRSTVNWVGTQVAKLKKVPHAGPYNIEWEAGDESLKTAILEALDLPKNPLKQFECQDLAVIARQNGASDVYEWLEKQRRVGGRSRVTVAELEEQVGRIVMQRRAFGSSKALRRIALTAHQAKNREFESVIILWPLSVTPGHEQQRRLLYNAITRAKRQAIVLVEDPVGDRLAKPPFTEL